MIPAARRTCPLCESRSDDGHLCHECRRSIRTALKRVVELWPRLQEAITRQTRMAMTTVIGPRAAKADEIREQYTLNLQRVGKPLPFDVDPAAIGDDIRAKLVGWVKLTVDEMGASIPPDSVPAFCWHVSAWLHRLAAHDAATDLGDEVLPMPGDMTRAIDYPDVRARILAGPCPTVGEDATCPGNVWAVMPQQDNPFMRCDTCTTTWDSTEWGRACELILRRRAQIELAKSGRIVG